MFTTLLANPNYLLFILLPIAAATAYIWGANNSEKAKRLNVDYFKALNDLLSDRTDQAIEAFSKLADSKQDEVDLHLALGLLFCRRGELDRAIYVHHRLMKNSALSDTDKARVQLALADNYFRSGILDRAESLLLSIIEQNNLNDTEALVMATKKILSIFEKEHAWQKAIEQCAKLEEAAGIVLQKQLAHYHCELANDTIDLETKKSLLRAAQSYDPKTPRPILQQIYLAIETDDLNRAISLIKQIFKSHPWLLPQEASRLSDAFDCRQGFIDYLQSQIGSATSPRLHSLLAKLYRDEGNENKALETLDRALEKAPSFLLLQNLLRTEWADSVQKDPRLAAMLNAASTLVNADAKFQCGECGISLVKHRWQCPGCQTWDSVMPLADIIPIPYRRPTN